MGESIHEQAERFHRDRLRVGAPGLGLTGADRDVREQQMRQGDADRRDRTFHLFVYGELRSSRKDSSLLDGCEKVAVTTVQGTLYHVDGRPALMLAGPGRVEGEVWRCGVERLPELDRHQQVADGIFRRVGVQVDEWACWTYVLGPKLAPRLIDAHRIESGVW